MRADGRPGGVKSPKIGLVLKTIRTDFYKGSHGTYLLPTLNIFSDFLIEDLKVQIIHFNADLDRTTYTVILKVLH